MVTMVAMVAMVAVVAAAVVVAVVAVVAAVAWRNRSRCRHRHLHLHRRLRRAWCRAQQPRGTRSCGSRRFWYHARRHERLPRCSWCYISIKILLQIQHFFLNSDNTVLPWLLTSLPLISSLLLPPPRTPSAHNNATAHQHIRTSMHQHTINAPTHQRINTPTHQPTNRP